MVTQILDLLSTFSIVYWGAQKPTPPQMQSHNKRYFRLSLGKIWRKIGFPFRLAEGMAVQLAHSRGCNEVPQARQLLTTTMNICSLPEIRNSLLRKLYLVPGRLRREQDLQICPAISLVEPECAAKAGRDLLGRNGITSILRSGCIEYLHMSQIRLTAGLW